MNRIQTFLIGVCLLLIGNTLLYSDTVGASTDKPAVIEADKESRELQGRTEDTGQESVFEMSLDELLEIEIVTASRIPEPWSKTISSVTVINAADLQRMGARSVYDALRTVPGISVDYNSRDMPTIEVRGIRKSFSSDNILFLLNGHSMNGVVSSAAPNLAMNDLPIANIKQIEVVRGPGSALYGTNAIIGVINIITKGPDEVEGVELSLDTEFEDEGSIGQKYNALLGKRFHNGIGFTLNVSAFDFDGPERFIDADSLGRSGSGDTEHDAVDLQGALEIGGLTLFGRYHTHDRAAFLGFTNVLNRDSAEEVDHAFLNAKMAFEVAKNTEITLTGYVDYKDADWFFEFFPAGSVPPPHPLSAWNSTGFISNLKWNATKTGGDMMIVYRGLDSHTLVAGIAGEHQRSFNIKHFANNNPGFLPVVQNVSDVFNWNSPADRDILAGYVEDIWEIRDHLKLNLGARYDHYSDFGGTFNPRLSLMWDFIENYSLRLSYSTAFRAPDFGDRFAKNVSGLSGDPDADPEEIETFEASLGARFTKEFSGRITYFHNDMDDLLGFPPGKNTVENFGSIKVDGIEVEAHYDFGNGSFLTANYTFTDSTDKDDRRSQDVPRHRGNFMANWEIIKHLNLNVNAYWQDEAPRALGDPRDSMSGYVIVNTTVMARNLWEKLDLEFSIHNLFDRDYTYPSPPSTTPKDYPAPGISFVLGAKFRF